MLRSVMTLPSLSTASTITRHHPFYNQTAVVRGRKFLRRPHGHTVIESRFSWRQRKSFPLTEPEVRTKFMFLRKCKRSVKNPATNWSVCHNLGSSRETVWPHYNNAVYIIASDMRFTSKCCIRWMNEYDTVYTIFQRDFGLFNEGKLKKGIVVN